MSHCVQLFVLMFEQTVEPMMTNHVFCFLVGKPHLVQHRFDGCEHTCLASNVESTSRCVLLSDEQ